MAKKISVDVITGLNGGLVVVPKNYSAPAKMAGSDNAGPDFYIVPKVDAQRLGETILAAMAVQAMKVEDVDDIDID